MKKCPAIKRVCMFYSYQLDSNGDVAICYCNHPKNTDEQEGNCTKVLCPLSSKSPICPYCGVTMIKTVFHTMNETTYGWQCGCSTLPEDDEYGKLEEYNFFEDSYFDY